MNTELTLITEKQLCTLEDKIRRGSAAFMEVGQALAKIRDGKGYQLRGFDTFELYCAKQFGITDRHGRRLIQSAETAQAVKKLTGETPANESVAREFTHLVEQPEQLKKVVAQIEKRGYSVVTSTAEAVKEAVQHLAPKPKPTVTSGSGHSVVLPSPATPAAAPASEPDGACPWCHNVPASYNLSEEVWQCSDCEGIVLLSVTRWPPQPSRPAAKAASGPTCPECSKPIKAGDSFCDHCGAML